jgi:hypothetical protein
VTCSVGYEQNKERIFLSNLARIINSQQILCEVKVFFSLDNIQILISMNREFRGENMVRSYTTDGQSVSMS